VNEAELRAKFPPGLYVIGIRNHDDDWVATLCEVEHLRMGTVMVKNRWVEVPMNQMSPESRPIRRATIEDVTPVRGIA
jgi:hypothetical protein